MKRYQAISRAIGAHNRCEQSKNEEWHKRWHDTLIELCKPLPSGSGFDSGTELSEKSTPEKLVFETSYHHMNSDGYYVGWTTHEIICTPSFELGIHYRITGRNQNDTKDYIGECFDSILNEDVNEYDGKSLTEDK